MTDSPYFNPKTNTYDLTALCEEAWPDGAPGFEIIDGEYFFIKQVCLSVVDLKDAPHVIGPAVAWFVAKQPLLEVLFAETGYDVPSSECDDCEDNDNALDKWLSVYRHALEQATKEKSHLSFEKGAEMLGAEKVCEVAVVPNVGLALGVIKGQEEEQRHGKKDKFLKDLKDFERDSEYAWRGVWHL